jgi:hypothetical protein
MIHLHDRATSKSVSACLADPVALGCEADQNSSFDAFTLPQEKRAQAAGRISLAAS